MVSGTQMQPSPIVATDSHGGGPLDPLGCRRQQRDITKHELLVVEHLLACLDAILHLSSLNLCFSKTSEPKPLRTLLRSSFAARLRSIGGCSQNGHKMISPGLIFRTAEYAVWTDPSCSQSEEVMSFGDWHESFQTYVRNPLNTS
jgi:hypothetical protein